jgi:hypothetical protein
VLSAGLVIHIVVVFDGPLTRTFLRMSVLFSSMTRQSVGREGSQCEVRQRCVSVALYTRITWTLKATDRVVF